MDNLQSQITRIIAKVEDYHLGFLAARVMESLNKFIIAKLAEQGKVLSPHDAEELSRKVEVARATESIRELDMYLLNYELMVKNLVDLNPGELEFKVAAELQEVATENAELSETLRERHPDDMAERGMEEKPKEPKEGKLLQFPPEKGRH